MKRLGAMRKALFGAELIFFLILIFIVHADAQTEEEGAAQVWVDIVGPDLIQPGQAQTFWISYGNRGNVDAIGVPLWIAGIPKNAVFTLNFNIAPPPVLTGQESIDWNQIPVHIETENGIVVPLLIPQIPPGYTGELSITLNIPPTVGQFQLQAWTNPSLFSSPLSLDFVYCVREVMVLLNIATHFLPGIDCALSVGQILFEYIERGGHIGGLQSISWWLASITLECTPFDLIDDALDAVTFILSGVLTYRDAFSSCSAAFRQPSSSDLSVQPAPSSDLNVSLSCSPEKVAQDQFFLDITAMIPAPATAPMTIRLEVTSATGPNVYPEIDHPVIIYMVPGENTGTERTGGICGDFDPDIGWTGNCSITYTVKRAYIDGGPDIPSAIGQSVLCAFGH